MGQVQLAAPQALWLGLVGGAAQEPGEVDDHADVLGLGTELADAHVLDHPLQGWTPDLQTGRADHGPGRLNPGRGSGLVQWRSLDLARFRARCACRTIGVPQPSTKFRS